MLRHLPEQLLLSLHLEAEVLAPCPDGSHWRYDWWNHDSYTTITRLITHRQAFSTTKERQSAGNRYPSREIAPNRAPPVLTEVPTVTGTTPLGVMRTL